MKTVLIVEDEKALRDGLRRILSREGYAALICQNGLEALDIIASNNIDVVVCDLKMPLMGAIELLERLGALCPGLPVIIVTGQGTPENTLECRTKGAFDFITKPFRISDLLSSIKCALEKRPPPPKL
jgi:DNA-binding NtrC family response regulator